MSHKRGEIRKDKRLYTVNIVRYKKYGFYRKVCEVKYWTPNSVMKMRLATEHMISSK